jgi:hypothetical protein
MTRRRVKTGHLPNSRHALKDINETWYASCIYRLSTNGLSDYRENPVPINRNGLLSKKITFKILNNGYDRFQ